MKKFIFTTLESFLENNTKNDNDNAFITLYHGSNKRFEHFKSSTCFFTYSSKFALDFTNTKSMDYGLDDPDYLYTVKLTSNKPIFDINNSSDITRLEQILPERIEYVYNDFGFTSAVSKEEYLQLLKGYSIIEPLPFLKDLKIGDSFPNPEYDREQYIVSNIDREYVYCYLSSNKNYIKKFNLIPITKELKNTWRFYENGTTENLLKRLGYIGFKALEKGIETIAIFRPDLHIKIINIKE